MFYKRSGAVFITVVLMLVALLFRIAYISFGGLELKVKAVAGGRNAKLTLYNSKGLIYDTDYEPLAGKQQCYYLIIVPRKFDKSKTDEILKITGASKKEFNENLLQEMPFVLRSYTLNSEPIDGVTVFEGFTRYSKSPIAQHILGYLDSDEIVGVSGVERAYNEELSRKIINVSADYSANAARGVIDDFNIAKTSIDSNEDYGVVLTINKQISAKAESIFKENISDGALIIMDAQNGDIITLCSAPEYKVEKIDEYINLNSAELLNNSLCNQPVGSVFKMIIAACAHVNGMSDFCFNCNGGINIGDRVFSCQNSTEHGFQTIDDAFSNSCNSYFIALSQLLGYDKILETSQLFGVDSSIELCKNIYSYSGKLPENEGIFSLANFAIGQGDLMMSPLSISRITAVMANGGYLINPNLYKGFYFDGTLSKENKYKYRTKILNDDVAEKLKKMCIQCVEVGTGKNARPALGGAGGKTASAQTGKFKNDGTEILSTYFSGFYPAENPKYVITVFAKDGKSGSATCAPVFKEICDFIGQNH